MHNMKTLDLFGKLNAVISGMAADHALCFAWLSIKSTLYPKKDPEPGRKVLARSAQPWITRTCKAPAWCSAESKNLKVEIPRRTLERRTLFRRKRAARTNGVGQNLCARRHKGAGRHPGRRLTPA